MCACSTKSKRGQLTAGIAHEIKNPLNFVNNFSALTRELLDELSGVLASAQLDKGRREEADELIGMAVSNLDKVVQHGKRADSIVKNMLLHSREGSGELTSVNINMMVEEALNLAYHGARAEKPGFKVTITKSLDPNGGVAELYPQEMTRVLLNLISNGFYATSKRQQSELDAAYEPTIMAATRDLGDRIEIAIRDNGFGIPDDMKAKVMVLVVDNDPRAKEGDRRSRVIRWQDARLLNSPRTVSQIVSQARAGG
jgi:signal transduction histidine kinase